jgi:hypothetical protein
MLRKYGWTLAAGLCLLAGAPANAQWYDGTKWEVTPFVGYETGSTYPINPADNTFGVTSLRSAGATSFGTFVDYSLTENFQAEFMWDRNNTYYSQQILPTPGYFKAFDSDIDQFQFGMLYMVMGSQHKLRPYFAGGLGFTHEANDNGTPNRTDFAYSIGGGLKYQWTKHIGFRGEARYMPTYANTSLQEYCSPFGCYEANARNYESRGNFVGGIIFSF